MDVVINGVGSLPVAAQCACRPFVMLLAGRLCFVPSFLAFSLFAVSLFSSTSLSSLFLLITATCGGIVFLNFYSALRCAVATPLFVRSQRLSGGAFFFLTFFLSFFVSFFLLDLLAFDLPGILC